MIIEDYYGFQGGHQQTSDLKPERTAQKTQKPQRPSPTDRKNMFARAMKRTQLSKSKLLSQNSQKDKRLTSPKPSKQEPHPESSAGRLTLYEPQQASDNRQELDNMTKKYDGYKNAESFEFKGTELNRANRPSHGPEGQNRQIIRRTDSKSGKQQSNRRRVQREPSQQQSNRKYHSFSRGKNQDFLVHFQRDVPIPPNAIERMVFNKTSATDLRLKKSKSMSAKLKPYKMHTFYHVDKRLFYNYNEEGYMTDRQYELLNKIEIKAKEAYLRAKAQEENERLEKKEPARKPREKKIQIEENSEIRHKNSRILSMLKHDYEQTPKDSSSSLSMSMKRLQQRGRKDENLQPSNPSKRSKTSKHDDYQMVALASGSKPEIEAKHQRKPQTTNLPTYAAEKDDDSLLQFKPSKPKPKQLHEDWVKRSSEISNDILSYNDINDYKSIDMMEINSNCKPTEREIRQKLQFIKDSNKEENRSFDMDLIKKHKKIEVSPPQSSKKSNEMSSHSKSQSSKSRNQSISSSEIGSGTNGRESKKESTPSSRNQVAINNIDFSKKRIRHSHSLSDNYTESQMESQNIGKTVPHSDKEHADNIPKTNYQLNGSDILRSSKDSASIDSKVFELQTKKIKVKKITKKSQKNSDFSSQKQLSLQSGYGSLGIQSIANEKTRNVSDLMKINLKPINEKNSKFQNEIESYHQSHDSHLKPKDSVLKSHQKSLSSEMKQRSQPSVAFRSKVRSSNNNNSSLQYDLFGEIRDFIEQEQCDYNQIRKAKEIKELISEQLDKVLQSIEDHLYIINCIAEIILLVPDVYDFETIYDKEKQWIFFQIFLTFKKYVYERNRVVTALRGGKNCFGLLNYIIEDSLLRRYLKRSEIVGILTDMEECNGKLELLLRNFYNFLIKFNKNYSNSPQINLKPFKNEQELIILLIEYDQQIDTLLKKKQEEFGEDGPIDEQELEMMYLVNERIFRLMEMGFVMSNLAGKQIKSYEKDEELYRDEKSFRNYIFENHQQFKQMIKYFK